MRKICRIFTSGSGEKEGLSSENLAKRRKTRICITLDYEVVRVLEEQSINKSRFINKLLRNALFGEGLAGLNSSKNVVGRGGFEPPTPGSSVRRSPGLSYRPAPNPELQPFKLSFD